MKGIKILSLVCLICTFYIAANAQCNLSLSRSSISTGATGGTENVIIYTTCKSVISESYDWISYSFVSSTVGARTIKFTISPNTSAQSRTATITISALGLIPIDPLKSTSISEKDKVLNTSETSNVEVNKALATGGQVTLTITQAGALPLLPGTPGVITGTSTVCSSKSATYSVSPITNATGYIWTVPPGASISSGQNTNIITVFYPYSGASSGNITVRGTNAAGSGPISTNFPVTVKPAPSAPGQISGTANVCYGNTGILYSVPPIANATSYEWFPPPGAIISTSGLNSNQIYLSFYGEGLASGSLTVQGKNECAYSSPSHFYITVNPHPSAPTGPIVGQTNVNVGQTNVQYTIPAIPNATGYYWTLPPGATIRSGDNTRSINVDFSSTATSGNITVRGRNDCGHGSDIESLAVTVLQLPGTPDEITGTPEVCAGANGINYSIPAISNATGYIWTVPPGASISSGQNTNSITIFYPYNVTSSGNITVLGTNAAGNGPVSPIYQVTINSLPTPGAISGNISVCEESDELYNVNTVNGATSYIWQYPDGEEVETIEPNFLWKNISNSGELRVKAVGSECSSEFSSPIDINVTPRMEKPGPISGDTEFCENHIGTFSVSSIPGASYYHWFSPSGGKSTSGSINNLTISQSGFVGVISGGNGCESEMTILEVFVRPSPEIMVNANKTEFEIGESIQLSAIGGLEYTWSPESYLNNTTGESVTATPTVSMEYSVTGTNDIGCTTTKSIRVNAKMQAVFSYAAPNLNVNINGGKAPFRYLWNGEYTTQSIQPKYNGTYSLTVTDRYGQVLNTNYEVTGYFDVTAADQNYIKTVIPLHEYGASEINNLDPNNSLVNCQYFDGLGKPTQTIDEKSSPSDKDIIQFVEYDEFGRQIKSYLPFTGKGVAGFRGKEGVLDEQRRFYMDRFPDEIFINKEGSFFSEIKYDNSPLNRVIEAASAGGSWRMQNSRTIETLYSTNAANQVKLWKVDANDNITSAYYTAGQLYITQTTDENDHWTKEYKDKQGKVILSEAEGGLKTYYVYDDFGLLRCVIPPAANEILNPDFCYYYKYDNKNRMIEKQIPGAKIIYMVYDNQDRLVLTQDGNLRTNNQWELTKYDVFSRPVLTGIYTDEAGRSRNVLEQNYNENFSEEADFKLVSETYYDNYNGLKPPTSPTSGINMQVKGLITGSKIVVPENSQELFTVNYYDKDYRVIQTIADNHLGGEDIIHSSYNFSGWLTSTSQNHNTANENSGKYYYKGYSYDKVGRITSIHQMVDGGPLTEIAFNEYNELGQLISKKIHKNSDNSYLYSNTFTYNIRSWLTKTHAIDKNDNMLFDSRLMYNYNSVDPANQLYNGNISAWQWSSSKLSEPRSYNYTYDEISRIKSATFAGIEGENYTTGYSYDKNGNILILTRNGVFADNSFGRIDQLDYAYKGNQLIKVNDLATDSRAKLTGFTEIGPQNTVIVTDPTTHEYRYDANGNMINDFNKGLELVEYNHLNLPTRIDLGNNNYIEYLYAGPVKIQQKVYKEGSVEKITDYIGNYVYENGALNYILTDEGRMLPKEGGGYDYEYFIKDHIGNTRVTLSDVDNNGLPEVMQEDHYYPFGLSLAGQTYNNPLQKALNKIKFQGQEEQDDFDLGWYHFKWRMYSPEIGRFMVVDPLAEKYTYNSPYAFSENKVVNGIELEGLEVRPTYAYQNLLYNRPFPNIKESFIYSPRNPRNTQNSRKEIEKFEPKYSYFEERESVMDPQVTRNNKPANNIKSLFDFVDWSIEQAKETTNSVNIRGIQTREYWIFHFQDKEAEQLLINKQAVWERGLQAELDGVKKPTIPFPLDGNIFSYNEWQMSNASYNLALALKRIDYIKKHGVSPNDQLIEYVKTSDYKFKTSRKVEIIPTIYPAQ